MIVKQNIGWERFERFFWHHVTSLISIDWSLMGIDEDYVEKMSEAYKRVFDEMELLEIGNIANPDEERMVGHYWLRPSLVVGREAFAEEIEDCCERVKMFAEQVHEGRVAPPSGGRFRNFLLIGIGGSALGPQLLADALGRKAQKMQPFFLDNTDPDGYDRLLEQLEGQLGETLMIIISKSGSTKETRNGMLEMWRAYRKVGLDPAQHTVIVTGEGSLLEKLGRSERVLEIFPMWDWVGGRTSLFSAVGMLPAALMGLDIESMRRGAARMDEITRSTDEVPLNPAAVLSLAWFRATEGKAKRSMVVLPYRDRLALLSRYLQQLVMESIGKELDLENRVVHQGLTVYGNKGSTDQHAFVQQLREGPDDYFLTFIEVRDERDNPLFEIEDLATAGDYLFGFLLGTRRALAETNHPSLLISLDYLNEESLGELIALFERAVGYYATLVEVNAYNQPGVEAGKKAADSMLNIQRRFLELLASEPEGVFDIPMAAERLRLEGQDVIDLYFIAERLWMNGRILGSEPFMRTQRVYQHNPDFFFSD